MNCENISDMTTVKSFEESYEPFYQGLISLTLDEKVEYAKLNKCKGSSCPMEKLINQGSDMPQAKHADKEHAYKLQCSKKMAGVTCAIGIITMLLFSAITTAISLAIFQKFILQESLSVMKQLKDVNRTISEMNEVHSNVLQGLKDSRLSLLGHTLIADCSPYTVTTIGSIYSNVTVSITVSSNFTVS